MKNNKEAQEYIFKKAADYRNNKKQSYKKMFLSTLSMVILIPVIAISLTMNSFNPNFPITDNSEENSEIIETNMQESQNSEYSTHSVKEVIYADRLTIPSNKATDWILEAGRVELPDETEQTFKKYGNDNTLFYVVVGASRPYNFSNEDTFMDDLFLDGFGTGEISVKEFREREIEYDNYLQMISPYLGETDYAKELVAETVEKLYKELFEKKGAPNTWEINNLKADSNYYEIEKVILREKEIFIVLTTQYHELMATERDKIYQDGLKSLDLEINEVMDYCFTTYISVNDIEKFKALPFGVEIVLLPKDATNEDILSGYGYFLLD